MIKHRVEACVGERQVHEVAITEVDQVADPAPLRMLCRHRDMGLANCQPCDVNAARHIALTSQSDERPVDLLQSLRHLACLLVFVQHREDRVQEARAAPWDG